MRTTLAADPSGNDDRGDFFAVDRRAWAKVSQLDINAMVAYLVLARGSGRDQRTTSWSVNAIEKYTGIGPIRGRQAIERLQQSGLVRVTRTGKRPRYWIMPAHEVPGCEGYPPPRLNAAERTLFGRLASGETYIPPSKRVHWTHNWQPRTVAAWLLQKGRVRSADNGRPHCYQAIGYDAAAAATADWIWLPNAIISGDDGEPAPVELLRQTQKAATLRLFIELYHTHALANDGGIHWRVVRQNFERVKLGEWGEFDVWGFRAGDMEAFEESFVIARFLTSKPDADISLPGIKLFWAAFEQLMHLGLVTIVEHLIEADNNTADIICPYALHEAGEPAEQRCAINAHSAGFVMLTGAVQKRVAADPTVNLAPVWSHIADVAMVGIARLRYRPRTSATARWLARLAEWEAVEKRYDEIGDAIIGPPRLAISRGFKVVQRSSRYLGNRYFVSAPCGVAKAI